MPSFYTNLQTASQGLGARAGVSQRHYDSFINQYINDICNLANLDNKLPSYYVDVTFGQSNLTALKQLNNVDLLVTMQFDSTNPSNINTNEYLGDTSKFAYVCYLIYLTMPDIGQNYQLIKEHTNNFSNYLNKIRTQGLVQNQNTLNGGVTLAIIPLETRILSINYLADQVNSTPYVNSIISSQFKITQS